MTPEQSREADALRLVIEGINAEITALESNRNEYATRLTEITSGFAVGDTVKTRNGTVLSQLTGTVEGFLPGETVAVRFTNAGRPDKYRVPLHQSLIVKAT